MRLPWPTLVPATLNGYPVISFDGVNDETRIPDANSLVLQQWDIFLVNAVTVAKNNNVWLYRFRQVDHDGTTSWSPVVPVLIEEQHEVLVVPDPAQDIVIVLLGPGPGKAEVRLINELGQNMSAPTVIQGNSARIGVGHLPEGNYVVMVITDRRVLQKRLIVARRATLRPVPRVTASRSAHAIMGRHHDPAGSARRFQGQVRARRNAH